MSNLPDMTTTGDAAAMASAAEWLARSLAGAPIPPLVIVIGPGRGHLLDVLERVAPDTRVLALEPDPATAPAFEGRRDWSRWRDEGRLRYLVGPDYAGADQAWRLFPPAIDDFKLLVDTAVARATGEDAVAAARLVKKIVFGARANATARRTFAPRYLRNSLANLPAITRGSDAAALVDAWKGVPAVIVGAGPSLDAVLPDLARAADRSLLVATDTALRPLLHAGLHPPLAVGVDPGASNARHFQALPDAGRTWLVAESGLDPSAAAVFDDRTFWFRLADHQPWPWFRSNGVDAGHVAIWGSVLTAAFQVAMVAGCDPIVLVGADLAYTGGRPYARGTTYEFDWAYSAAIGDPLTAAWRMQMAMCDRAEVEDVNGRPALTTEPLVAFRDWMVRHAAASGRRVVNATGAGILGGPGIEQQSLAAILDRARDVRSPATITRRVTTSRTADQLAGTCRTAAASLTTRDEATEPASAWRQFLGDGFDAPALAGTLEQAAAAFDRRADDPHPSGPTRSWTSGLVAGGAGAVLRRLPETIAHLRQTLNGVPAAALPPAGDPAHPIDPQDGLIEAFAALASAAPACLRFSEDPGAPLPRHGTGTSPAAGRRAWPASIGWPLLVAEALLHESRRPGRMTLEDHFFSRTLVPRALPPRADGADAPRVDAAAGTDAAAMRLCADLVRDWLTAVTDLGGLDRITMTRLAQLRVGLDHAVTPEGRPHAHAGLVILSPDGTPVRLPLAVDGRLLARAFTGLVVATGTTTGTDHDLTRPDATTPLLVTPVGAAGAAIGIEWPEASGPWSVDPSRAARSLVVTPRVLTEEGAPRSASVFPTSRGAACAPLHGTESYVIDEDGGRSVLARWPRPIVGHARIDGGLVAWSNGTARWPDLEDGYVMHRSDDGGPVTTEPLPFRPTAGVWWHGRMYWSCFTTGLGSWAPGEAARIESRDLTLVAVRDDGTNLALEPCTRDASGAAVRRWHTSAWRRGPHGGLEPRPAGRWGVTACRSADTGWTAEAHPDADLVALASDRGPTAVLSCFTPHTLAWAGRSLVVCTQGGDVLLFERLADRLDDWFGARPPALPTDSRR